MCRSNPHQGVHSTTVTASHVTQGRVEYESTIPRGTDEALDLGEPLNPLAYKCFVPRFSYFFQRKMFVFWTVVVILFYIFLKITHLFNFYNSSIYFFRFS
jgi:hypothetical protein